MTGYVRTPEQLDVVAHPLVPLRIAAGAGTGKTATVTDRIGHAIAELGIAPEATLGITFTNKAADELADRLRAALPQFAEHGREVEVTTYHGFAFSLLHEFGAFVGIERDVAVIGPGYVRQLLFESLEGGEYRALDMSAASHRVADAATLSSQLGDNLLSAADLASLAPSKPTGPWPERLELAGIVERYDALKRRLRVVDYADLIRFAHALVEQRPEIAARIRDRYAIVVLDEYQDTAPAQRELLRRLFDAGFPITAVGDADQTIYEWRGASRENFDAFPEHFPLHDGSAAPTLPLTVNHRSGSHILEVAHAVRSRLHEHGRYQRLMPEPGSPTGIVSARWFRTASDEATWIADELRRLHEEEGIPWSDMAVLFRKNRQIALVRDACSVADIPVEVASLGGLLDVPEVADLVAWLRLLHFRDDTISLARILLGSRYRLGLGDIAVLERWAAGQGMWRGDDEGPSWPLLEAVDRVDEVTGLSDEARRRVTRFRDLYRAVLTAAQSLSLVELARTVLDAIEAWDEIQAMQPAAALSARLNLYRFLDLTQEWSPLEGRPSLEGFLGYLELLRDDSPTEELDTARVGGSDAVALLTVHRAKGLEWNSVFLPALAEGIFPARSLGHDNPADYGRYVPFEFRLDADSLPDLNVPKPERAAALAERHLYGEWRTAYVAVTRAERRLYATGAHWYDGLRPKAPSPLYELVAACPVVEEITLAADPGERPERNAIDPATPAPDPLFPDGWRAALREAAASPETPIAGSERYASYAAEVDQLRLIVEGLPAEREPAVGDEAPPLSVTSLVTLASCPKRFYWTDVDPLPRRPSAALRRGVELHRRIELRNRGSMPFDELQDDLYDTPFGAAAEAPSPGRAFKTFLRSRFADRTPRFIETPIDLRVAETRVRGRIDAVYEGDGGGWEIVDYKSGRPPESGSMVQLQAYALAARDGAIAADPPDDIRVTFLYLGAEEPAEVGAHADPAWLDQAEAAISALVAEAAEPPYRTVPSLDCRHCDFLKFCADGRSHLETAV